MKDEFTRLKYLKYFHKKSITFFNRHSYFKIKTLYIIQYNTYYNKIYVRILFWPPANKIRKRSIQHNLRKHQTEFK